MGFPGHECFHYLPRTLFGKKWTIMKNTKLKTLYILIQPELQGPSGGTLSPGVTGTNWAIISGLVKLTV